MPNLEELVSKYHWLQIGEDGVLEMFLDHHSLQAFRQCEAYFELLIMANVKPQHRSWNLTFGILYHEMLEIFYKKNRDGNFDINKWLTHAAEQWQVMNMAEFEKHKVYISLGGIHGFLAMLGQYVTHFAAEVDRLRPIAIEVAFGKKKEVPLGEFEVTRKGYSELEYHSVRAYLTGRLDFLMDSGSAIGPLDHKTTANFMGKNPANSFDPQEGMTGYIFATQQILKNHFPELAVTRKCDRIWMSFAQITPTKEAHERFKRVPIFKTEYQLEQYRLRQISTFSKIYDMVVLGRTPDWNTAICNNFFHSECQYRNLHRQNTQTGFLNVLNSDFVIGEQWNPEEVKD